MDEITKSTKRAQTLTTIGMAYEGAVIALVALLCVASVREFYLILMGG